ncbi:MAG TPA: hypothetical protein VFC99_01260 [Acidimicrobiia bacterium]|nr:hypothetical protein [Acidimicrobiia bacterium]
MFWNRRDGTLVTGLPLNRRAMPYVMSSRPQSAFYFSYDVRLTKTEAFLREFNARYPETPADVLHVALFALRDVYIRYPSLNRFVAGGRIYDRNEILLSYSSRHAPVSGAPAATIKRCFDPRESFEAMVADMHDDLHCAEPRPTGITRVAERVMRAPGVVRRLAFGSVRLGNAFGLLPRSYTDGDPLFTSAYLTDLTRTGLPHGYAHLHEHGTCTVVCVLGTPRVDPTHGHRVLPVTFTFDERTEDGLVSWFGLKHFQRVLEDPCGAGLAGLDAFEQSPDARSSVSAD